MVVKTELCAFSEYRIYPGHGMRYVRKDGQMLILSTSKAMSMTLQKKKPAKLKWTQAWRRMHKKIRTEDSGRRRTRRNVKVQRGIVGASLEEIKKKQLARPAKTPAQLEAEKKAAEEKRAALKAAREASKASAPKVNVPKVQRTAASSNTRGGAKR